MLVIYNKESGKINHTVDYEYNTSSVVPKDDQEILAFNIEIGSAIVYFRVNPETKQLEVLSGLQIIPDKNIINIGETVNFTLISDTKFDSINLTVGDKIVEVTSSNFSITFHYPGEYFVYPADSNYYCLPIKISVLYNNGSEPNGN